MRHKQDFTREALESLLDATSIGHLGFTSQDGGLHVLPVAVARLGDELIWHGSTGSGWLRALGAERVSLCISSVEALVVGRSRFENSFWYRSAVVYGTPRRLQGEEAVAGLDALTEHVLPGRLAETRPSTPREVAATAVFAMPLNDWVLKDSRQWPDDPVEDRGTPVWAGIVPMSRVYGTPVPAPDLDPDTPLPASCQRLIHGSSPRT